MKLFFGILILAFCCATPMLAPAQTPQQTNISEVRHFPNPAGSNGSVISISFSLAVPAFVNIKVFNPLGIQLKELSNGTFAAGEHSIPFDVSPYNDGVYFYTVRVGDHSETKKLTIKK
ncbi:hypothetical protein BH09BAC1_BH09BAC1_11700 [soil metagenome]